MSILAAAQADGEGGDNQPQTLKATGTTSGNNKEVPLPFRNSGTTSTEGDDEVRPNVPH